MRPYAFIASLALLALSCSPPVWAQATGFKNIFEGVPGLDGTAGLPAAAGSPQVLVSLTPANAQPRDVVTLAVTIKVPADSWTYSTSLQEGGLTRILVEAETGLDPLDAGFTPDHPATVGYEPLLKVNLGKYRRDVTWTRRYRLQESAVPEQVLIRGVVSSQLCDTRTCHQIKHAFAATLIASTAPVGTVEPESPAAANSVSQVETTAAVSHPYETEIVPKLFSGKDGPSVVSARLFPDNAQPGDKVTLEVQLAPNEGWHTYSISQPPGNYALPTSITLTEQNGLKPFGSETWFPDHPPEIKHPEPGKVQEVYHDAVTWTRTFEVTPEAATTGYGISGRISYQICQSSCVPQKAAFELGMLTGAATEVTAASTRGTVGGDEPAAAGAVVPAATAAPQGLLPFLATAIIAGFLALLTPCVFPMVPITVSFFLKQSEKEHHRPVTMALIYCGGIVAAFTVIGLLMAAFFGAASLNQLANHPWLNIAIAAVLVFFGFNLLGLFEIRVPSWLLTWSAGKEGQGGVIGVLFMALTFTLVSFTCTFAFIGGLLVYAANGEYYWPIIGMLAFSAAFALPFFFLAIFPSYLQKLPKSGGWMNRVKVTMGLIECGAAFKFLNVADLAVNPEPMFFDYAMVMSAWLVLSIAAGLYLLGFFRLPHDTKSESIPVPQFAFALTFLGLAGYLAVGLFAPEKPSGKVWEQIAAFAPPKFSAGEGDIGPYLDHHGLRYALDYDRALEAAQKESKPLFVDITGVNCVNCRQMELKFAKPQIHRELERFVRAQLYVDNVPSIQDQNLANRLLEKNLKLQTDWFGDVTLPSYAIISPNGKDILATFMGNEPVEGQFAEFLRTGYAKWEQASPGAASSSQTAAAESSQPKNVAAR